VFGLLLAGCLLFLGLQAWWVLTPGVAVRSGPRMVEIPAHRGFLDVARILGEAGVIRSPVGFTLLTLVRGSMRSLKAGEYQIPGGANTVAVLTMLEGGHVLQHSVVFREGATVAELAGQLAAEGLARADDVVRAARDAPQTWQNNDPTMNSLAQPSQTSTMPGLAASTGATGGRQNSCCASRTTSDIEPPQVSIVASQ